MCMKCRWCGNSCTEVKVVFARAGDLERLPSIRSGAFARVRRVLSRNLDRVAGARR